MSSLEARQLERSQAALHRCATAASVAKQWPDAQAAGAWETGPENGVTRAPEITLTDLVEITVAAFRRHPHICNVMTHISRDRWDKVGKSLHAILDPLAKRGALSPLAENIIDLLCAESGVTGRILKPYFRDLLDRILPPDLAARLGAHVGCLFMELEQQRAQACRRAAAVHPCDAVSWSSRESL